MNIDSKSKKVLKFRPKIEFVEPEQEPASPNPIQKEPLEPTLAELTAQRQRIKKLADAINLLAAAVQVKIDDKAKDQIVVLDRNVDAATIASLRRTYPNASVFNQITYDQYRRCRESIASYGRSVGLKAIISQKDIDDARADLEKGNFNVGGVFDEAARNGGLRPDLDKRAQIIEPLDLDKFQNELIKILVNYIWKNFLRPILALIPFAAAILPQELIKVKKSTKKMMSNLEDQGVETL